MYRSGGTFGELNGMPLVQMAVNSAVGEMGIHFVTFAIFAFAFSSFDRQLLLCGKQHSLHQEQPLFF